MPLTNFGTYELFGSIQRSYCDEWARTGGKGRRQRINFLLVAL
jgi:hypothetical protein